jgi:uncharacterized spore protein YtfJ
MARPRPFAPLRKSLRARDVFGKPVKSGGVTVVPVAAISGGGGGSTGEGSGESGARNASGLGFGFRARPIGAYVIRDGKVRWRPAVDVTRLAIGAMVTGAVIAGLALKSR